MMTSHSMTRSGGRILALVGIVLFAFSLRTAVASLSPIMGEISGDFAVPTVVVGLVGTAPPVCYAIFAVLTPAFARRLGLQPLVTLAIVVAAAGMIARALAGDATSLVISTVVIFAAVGVGNVLLPPLAKQYFPDRFGVITTLYATAMGVANFVSPALAMPVANAAGWRASLGLWAVFSVAALVPWIALSLRSRAEGRAAAVLPGVTPVANPAVAALWRSPVAWSITVIFWTTGALAYTMFAWLPQVLVDIAQVSPTEAGALLSVFAFVGLPAAILTPLIASRMRNGIVLLCGVALGGGLVGLTGLLLAPTLATWVWVPLMGTGTVLFPLAMTLIGLRAGGAQMAIVLSGFVQSVGYAVAAVFPFLFGVLHEISGGWTLPLILMLALLAGAIPAVRVVARPQTVDNA